MLFEYYYLYLSLSGLLKLLDFWAACLLGLGNLIELVVMMGAAMMLAVEHSSVAIVLDLQQMAGLGDLMNSPQTIVALIFNSMHSYDRDHYSFIFAFT